MVSPGVSNNQSLPSSGVSGDPSLSSLRVFCNRALVIWFTIAPLVTFNLITWCIWFAIRFLDPSYDSNQYSKPPTSSSFSANCNFAHSDLSLISHYFCQQRIQFHLEFPEKRE